MLLTMGKLCFAGIGLVVGIHLFRDCLVKRELGLPALTTGAIFVGGSGLLMVTIGTGMGSGDAGRWTATIGEVAMRAGVVLLSIFIWKTFRPGGPAGMIGAVVCGGTLIASLVWDLRAQEGWWPYDNAIPSAFASQFAIALPFAWSGVESFTIWRRLRRQAAIGLNRAPVLSNRFALWTIATSAFVGICLLAVVAGIAHRHGAASIANAAEMGRGLLYLVVSGSIWLGLFARGSSGRRTTDQPA